MENIKTGDIIFFRSKFKWYAPMSWLSTMIRLVAGIKYNHVGIIVFWGKTPMVLEAIGRGIVPTALDIRFRASDCKIVRPKKVAKHFVDKAVSYAGHTKYDVFGLIWHQLIWNITGYRLWIGRQRPDTADKSLYCYEYAALMEGDKDWWMVKPKEYLERKRKVIHEPN